MTEKLFEEIFNSDEENKNRADAVSGQVDSNGLNSTHKMRGVNK